MLVNSIFNSIDGEVNFFGQGLLTTFIRLQGCNLKCSYCDTPQAQSKLRTSENFEITPMEIIKQIKILGRKKVTITGGEPLTQRKELLRLVELIPKFFGWEFHVTIETNGSKSLKGIFDMACWVVDYKLPSSGMEGAMNHEAFCHLCNQDVVKFVIQTKEDFNVATQTIEEIWPISEDRVDFPLFAFSPVYKKITPARLLSWLNETSIPKQYKTALNIQLHKIINLP